MNKRRQVYSHSGLSLRIQGFLSEDHIAFSAAHTTRLHTHSVLSSCRQKYTSRDSSEKLDKAYGIHNAFNLKKFFKVQDLIYVYMKRFTVLKKQIFKAEHGGGGTCF